MLKIISVVGARPNFIKAAPVHKAFQKYPDRVNHLVCHTGQHFDDNMSKIFLNHLCLTGKNMYWSLSTGPGM